MVGKSFHGLLMKVHARTGPVAVADLEKMLHKVPLLLGDVDLYSGFFYFFRHFYLRLKARAATRSAVGFCSLPVEMTDVKM